MAQEIELKLLVLPVHFKALRAGVHALMPDGARLSTRRLVSHYFDAPDFVLWNTGIALRVRKVGRRWIQTLKSGGVVQAGLHSRVEWESPVSSPQPDLARLVAAHPADAALRTAAAQVAALSALHHIFVTDFRRSAVTIDLDESGVEIALDQGVITAGERSVAFCEMELELKKGKVSALFHFARVLRHSAPLRVGQTSKAERGYALLNNAGLPAPAKAKPVQLDAGMTLDDAFATCLTACVTQMQENEPGFQGEPGAEYVHQMRVAIRRLRALFGLMNGVVPKTIFAPVNAELKWLAGALGPARDWYVFLHETLPPLAEAAERQQLALLEQRASMALEEGVHAANNAVQSERYTDLMLALGEFSASHAWRTENHDLLVEPVESFAVRLLRRRHRQLLKRGTGLREAQPETRHAVRIGAKKLRYGLEFFINVLPEKRARPVQSVLAELQDLLGSLNDAAVAQPMIARLCSDDPSAAMQRAAGLVQGWLLARREGSLAALDKTWTRFAGLRSPVQK